MKSLANLSLFTRVMLLTAIGLLLGAGLLSYLGVQAVNKATEMMLEDRLITAGVVADYVDEFLGISFNILQDRALNLSPGQPDELKSQVLDTWEIYSHISIQPDSLYIINEAGEITWSEPVPAEPFNVNHLKSVLAETGNDKTVSVLTTSPVTNNPVVLLSAAIPNAAGNENLKLVLAIDVAESEILGLVQPLKLGETGYVEVVDENGVVVIRTKPGPEITPFEKSDHSGHFSELIEKGEPTRGLCHTCHVPTQTVITRDVLAFTPLSVARWGVVIRQSEDEALAPVRSLRQQLLLSGFALVAVVFILTIITTRDVVSRIRKLTAVSSKIADGDFDSPAVSSRQDEIGTLAQTLETMRSRLKTSYSDLERRTKELSSLLSISEILASLPILADTKSALLTALDRAIEVVGANAGGILLQNEEKDAYVFTISRGFSRNYYETISYTSNGGGPISRAATTGKVVVENEPGQMTEATLGEQPEIHPVKTLVAIPLLIKRETIGMLVLANLETHEYSTDDIRLVEGVARYISAALENTRLHQEIQLKEEMRGELVQGLLSVQEEERGRIARELHDETAQVLASLNANIQAAVGILPTDTEKAQALLKKVQSMSVGVLENMNKLIYQLRPSLLDDLGLVAAIRWLADNNIKPAGVRVTVKTTGKHRRLTPDVETAVFRVVQEAFNNIVRHANAKRVSVTLHFAANTIRAEVRDDGVGFDVDEAIHSKIRPRGLGLLGMTERIELIGGKIVFKSTPSEGTEIHIEIPVEEEVREDEDEDTAG